MIKYLEILLLVALVGLLLAGVRIAALEQERTALRQQIRFKEELVKGLEEELQLREEEVSHWGQAYDSIRRREPKD